MLNNVLLVTVLTAQLLPAAVVTGDSDQAKPWCTCLVLRNMNSHCSVPGCMCWHRDTHCGYLHVSRLERTPVIQDPQFCQDHPAHSTQSAELSTRMWFQWVRQHQPLLRGALITEGSWQCALLGFPFTWDGEKSPLVRILLSISISPLFSGSLQSWKCAEPKSWCILPP